MDSFKLVKIPLLILCIIWGMLCAIGAYFINTLIINGISIEVSTLKRYIAPAVEETLKMGFVIFLILKSRIGFMIDGAIYGFAIGTGFALVENLWYLWELDSSNMLLWTVRGFGTAIMHGGTTSVFCILLMQAFDKGNRSVFPFLYAWLGAIVMHSFFNHFLLPPVAMMLFTLFIIAFCEIIIFRYSERNLRKWLELEFDSEVKLLMMIRKGKLAQTNSGEYLNFIKEKFSQLVVFDMLAYISLYLELSIRVKSMLMLREAGIPVVRDPETEDKLAELRSLERNIGMTGLLAVSPILRTSRKDLWKWSTLK